VVAEIWRAGFWWADAVLIRVEQERRRDSISEDNWWNILEDCAELSPVSETRLRASSSREI